MTKQLDRYLVSVAHSLGGDIAAFTADLSVGQVDRLNSLLVGLCTLGHVAAFSIVMADTTRVVADVVQGFRDRFGSIVIDALLTAEPAQAVANHAFLLPVWPFDHELNGLPASTARFLSLDLELIANPSSDEEEGTPLPGRPGLWMIYARPILF